MTIIERLEKHKQLEPSKVALVIDNKEYTYGELYDAIQSIDMDNTSGIIHITVHKADSKSVVTLIQRQSFFEQLVQWLGGLYQGRCPMVCHNEMD